MPTGVYLRTEYHKKIISDSQKGRIPWNKGKKIGPMTQSQKDKISLGCKRNGVGNWMNGTRHTEERKKKMSMMFSGIGNPFYGKRHTKDSIERMSNFKPGHTPWNKGRPFIEVRGEKHWRWNNGATPKNHAIRNSLEYKLWRRAVFDRDKYTCVFCGNMGGRIEADHIKPFAFYPELRFELSNGRTLCKPCHKKTDTYLNAYYKKQ